MTVPLTYGDLWAFSEDLLKGICENPQTNRGILRSGTRLYRVEGVEALGTSWDSSQCLQSSSKPMCAARPASVRTHDRVISGGSWRTC